MKISRFTKEQIIADIRSQVSGEKTVERVSRKLGISQATFFKWKMQYGGVTVLEAQRLRMLESENARLKSSCPNELWSWTHSRMCYTQPLPERLTDVGTRRVKKL